jgi:hypothetical protein
VKGGGIQELEKLVQVISDPSTRRSFIKDAEGTLQKAGVKADALPKNVVDALAELTPAELRLVSHLNSTLFDAGYRAPDSGSLAIV